MLTNTQLDVRQDVSGFIAPVETVHVPHNDQDSANADRFARNAVFARRMRRQRRAERNARRVSQGWTARMW